MSQAKNREKTKFSKLRLRSSGAKSQISYSPLPQEKISKYFSSVLDGTQCTQPEKNSEELFKSDTESQCAQKFLESCNDKSTNDENDFAKPKMVAPIAKIFERKPQKETKKKQATSKKITSVFEKHARMEVTCSDTNQEQLQMALAMSKSLEEYKSQSSVGDNTEYESPFPSTQEKILTLRSTLDQFGFKSNKSSSEFSKLLTNSRQNIKKKFRNIVPTLFLRTDVDRAALIENKVSQILANISIYNETNSEKSPGDEINESANNKPRSFHLRDYYNESSVLFKRNTLDLSDMNDSIFYNNTVPVEIIKVGSLLKDWASIPGREKTPPPTCSKYADEKDSEKFESNEAKEQTLLSRSKRTARQITADVGFKKQTSEEINPEENPMFTKESEEKNMKSKNKELQSEISKAQIALHTIVDKKYLKEQTSEKISSDEQLTPSVTTKEPTKENSEENKSDTEKKQNSSPLKFERAACHNAIIEKDLNEKSLKDLTPEEKSEVDIVNQHKKSSQAKKSKEQTFQFIFRRTASHATSDEENRKDQTSTDTVPKNSVINHRPTERSISPDLFSGSDSETNKSPTHSLLSTETFRYSSQLLSEYNSQNICLQEVLSDDSDSVSLSLLDNISPRRGKNKSFRKNKEFCHNVNCTDNESVSLLNNTNLQKYSKRSARKNIFDNFLPDDKSREISSRTVNEKSGTRNLENSDARKDTCREFVTKNTANEEITEVCSSRDVDDKSRNKNFDKNPDLYKNICGITNTNNKAIEKNSDIRKNMSADYEAPKPDRKNINGKSTEICHYESFRDDSNDCFDLTRSSDDSFEFNNEKIPKMQPEENLQSNTNQLENPQRKDEVSDTENNFLNNTVLLAQNSSVKDFTTGNNEKDETSNSYCIRKLEVANREEISLTDRIFNKKYKSDTFVNVYKTQAKEDKLVGTFHTSEDLLTATQLLGGNSPVKESIRYDDEKEEIFDLTQSSRESEENQNKPLVSSKTPDKIPENLKSKIDEFGSCSSQNNKPIRENMVHSPVEEQTVIRSSILRESFLSCTEFLMGNSAKEFPSQNDEQLNAFICLLTSGKEPINNKEAEAETALQLSFSSKEVGTHNEEDQVCDLTQSSKDSEEADQTLLLLNNKTPTKNSEEEQQNPNIPNSTVLNRHKKLAASENILESKSDGQKSNGSSDIHDDFSTNTQLLQPQKIPKNPDRIIDLTQSSRESKEVTDDELLGSDNGNMEPVEEYSPEFDCFDSSKNWEFYHSLNKTSISPSENSNSDEHLFSSTNSLKTNAVTASKHMDCTKHADENKTDELSDNYQKNSPFQKSDKNDEAIHFDTSFKSFGKEEKAAHFDTECFLRRISNDENSSRLEIKYRNKSLKRSFSESVVNADIQYSSRKNTRANRVSKNLERTFSSQSFASTNSVSNNLSSLANISKPLLKNDSQDEVKTSDEELKSSVLNPSKKLNTRTEVQRNYNLDKIEIRNEKFSNSSSKSKKIMAEYNSKNTKHKITVITKLNDSGPMSYEKIGVITADDPKTTSSDKIEISDVEQQNSTSESTKKFKIITEADSKNMCQKKMEITDEELNYSDLKPNKKLKIVTTDILKNISSDEAESSDEELNYSTRKSKKKVSLMVENKPQNSSQESQHFSHSSVEINSDISDEELNYSSNNPYRQSTNEHNNDYENFPKSVTVPEVNYINFNDLPQPNYSTFFTGDFQSNSTPSKIVSPSETLKHPRIKELCTPVNSKCKSSQPKALLSDSDNEILAQVEGLSGTDSRAGTPENGGSNDEILTPNGSFVVKTRNVTPMGNYSDMDTPERNKELEKFGLKPMKRARGIKMLRYIYEATHPVREDNIEKIRDSSSDNEGDRVIKRRKKNSDKNEERLSTQKKAFSRKSSSNDVTASSNDQKIEILGNEIAESEKLENMIFERKQSCRILSCRIPLHIAWHNLVSTQQELQEKILLYEPLQVEDIYAKLKSNGYKFHIQDIISFLDKKCITIRVAQNTGKRCRTTK